MSEEQTTDRQMDDLKQSLTDIQTTEVTLIEYLKEVLKESDGVSKLMDGKIGRLFEVAKCYKTVFDRLKVTSRREFQDQVKANYRNVEIRDLEEDIFTLEEEISESGGRVLVVSFGDQKGAQQWLAETKCPFPMLLDPQRKVYKAFGLHRSVYKVWGIEEMVYYAETMVKMIPLPKPSQYVHDDPQQMGGDFIINKAGIVSFVYCSKKSFDRPTVADLLDNLKKS